MFFRFLFSWTYNKSHIKNISEPFQAYLSYRMTQRNVVVHVETPKVLTIFYIKY